MISAILLINLRGDIVLTRFYRDDVRQAAHTARPPRGSLTLSSAPRARTLVRRAAARRRTRSA